MYVYYNPNPKNNLVGDCVIRAITYLTGNDWDTTYIGVAVQGLTMKDMPSSNRVWGEYLKNHGFERYSLPDTCPVCYTVKDFCRDYPKGKYIVATGTHVVAVEDGRYYDTWDSGDETVVYCWRKEQNYGLQ